MGECRTDGPNGPVVKSADEVLARVSAELGSRLPGWRSRLRADPAELPVIEQEVQEVCGRQGDLLVIGLIAEMAGPELEDRCEATRVGFAYPVERGRQRQISIQMLGGTMLWLTSLFCSARRRADRPPDEARPGVYVEQVQFGFGNGCTPGVESKVARQAALLPSLELARAELEREGLSLDVKTVRRIARDCGEGLLRMRRLNIEAFRSGTLPAEDVFKGRRVVVQLDGGRVRIRGDMRELPKNSQSTTQTTDPLEDPPGRSRKKRKRTYDADWREPKLVTIFVSDSEGRMDPKFKATIDSTLEGPDVLAEIIAMHLHRLGAAAAASVTFVADGAVWIWDRIPKIVQMAGLENVPLHEVLDCPHAIHHVSRALASLGLGEAERQPLYREHRTLLRNGQWRRVVEELEGLAEGWPEDSKIWTEIAYLRRHGEAGRLKYPTFRGLGVPIGSGAIESSIRRVVNMRIKGNAIFWRQDMAEAMLQLRSRALTDRWDESLAQLRELRRHDARTDWKWQPRDMSSNGEPAVADSD